MTADGLLAGVSLAAVTGIVLFVVARARARTIETSAGEERVHALRVCLRRMAPVAAGCGSGSAAVCIVLTRWPGIGAGGAVVTALVAAACFAFPIAAARQPVMAAYARVRGIPARAFRSYRQLAVVTIRVVLTVWPIVAGLTVRSSLAAAAGIVVVSYLVINPVLTGLLAPVMARILGGDAVAGTVQARLSSLAAEAGVHAHGRVVHTRARRVANAMYLGWIPGLCCVLITDYLLDQMSPAEIDAVLAHELGHGRNHDGLLRSLLGYAAVVPPVLVIVGEAKHGPGGYLAGVLALFIAFAIGFRRLYGSLAIRWELRADDLAARLVGPAALAAALTRLTELNAIKRDTSRSWDRMVGHPGMAIRITRLQTAAAHAASDQ